jgi:hypothetical protein
MGAEPKPLDSLSNVVDLTFCYASPGHDDHLVLLLGSSFRNHPDPKKGPRVIREPERAAGLGSLVLEKLDAHPPPGSCLGIIAIEVAELQG